MTKNTDCDSFIETVMNLSDEKITQIFADMGIEINLNKPFEIVEYDEGTLVDE